jgi:hypothetical protein
MKRLFLRKTKHLPLGTMLVSLISQKAQQRSKRKSQISILHLSLRVEVSLFVLSPEIEDRNAVEVDNWAKHKKSFYSE